MAKKAAAADKKADNKKGGDKKAKGGEDASGSADKQAKSKGGLKAATAVNVRHILCEKHSKATEALQKIQEGQSFNKVAQEFSEDKAKVFVAHCSGWEPRMDDTREHVDKPKISPLVKTNFGYHIIMVEGRR